MLKEVHCTILACQWFLSENDVTDEDVYMINNLKVSMSSDTSAIGTGVVRVPVSTRVRAVDVVADSAHQTVAETTLNLCNAL